MNDHTQDILAAIVENPDSKVSLGLIYSIPNPVSNDRCNYVLWSHLPESNRGWVQLKACVRPSFNPTEPMLSGYDFHVEFRMFQSWVKSGYAVRIS